MKQKQRKGSDFAYGIPVRSFSQPSLDTGRSLKNQLAESAKASGFSKEEPLDRTNELAERYGARLMKGRWTGRNATRIPTTC